MRKRGQGAKSSVTESSLSIMLWLIAQRFTRREQMTLQIINYTKTEGKRHYLTTDYLYIGMI